MGDSDSSDQGPGPQKIALPNHEKPTPPSKKGGKEKPAWLLPVGLVVFLIIGLVLIFALKPGDDKVTKTPSATEDVTDAEAILANSSDSQPIRTLKVLTPEELKKLQEEAKAAVAAQANQERTHAFQRILFGKAASQLADADAAMSANRFENAQIGYEDTLTTINNLTESYEAADQIASVQEGIQLAQNTLAEKGASLQETDRYQMLLSNISDAEAQLNNGDFKEALSQLQAVEQSMKELITEGEQTFQTALQEGLKALNSGDGETAKKYLSIAKGLRPNDAFIARQLERAEVIEQVFVHFNQGIAFEQQGLDASARVEYQKALELDPDSVNINTRLQNINQRLNEDLFKTALSDGLKALTDGNGDAAVEFLGKATSLNPSDEQARSALTEARELQRRQNVERLITTGQQALKNAQWEIAHEAFQEALDYEPSSEAAQQGLAQAKEQIAREEQLKQLLREAETFERNGEFEKALIILREGRQVADPAGAVSQKIAFLEGILEEQSNPQKVTILSDGNTDIEIYKVGKFKPATQFDLDLRPGEYTVIGSRLMYRDVRYTLKVEIGEQPKPLKVICQDKL